MEVVENNNEISVMSTNVDTIVDEESCESKQHENASSTKKKGRKNSPFPSIGAKDCIQIPEGIWKYASGDKIRRTILFDKLGKSPDSGPSRTMVTSSSKYGFTTGGYNAEFLVCTEKGAVAFNPDVPEATRLKYKFDLIIDGIEAFNKLYFKYKGSKLPIKDVMVDYLAELSIDEEYREDCISVFLDNLRFLGLLKVLSGAERLIPIEQAIEEISDSKPSDGENTPIQNTCISSSAGSTKTCFYISPIGEDNSEERKHSDLFLESIVSPAFEKFGYTVVRADQIGSPGMITSQIIEYIMDSDFVVCDLSFHNPNVFYELALRHTTKRATIHIIRKNDSIPFDVNDCRTIIIDDSSIYTFVPAIPSYIDQISQQISQIIENKVDIDNPVISYLNRKSI